MGDLAFHSCFIRLASITFFVFVLHYSSEFGVAEFSHLVCMKINVKIRGDHFLIDYLKRGENIKSLPNKSF